MTSDINKYIPKTYLDALGRFPVLSRSDEHDIAMDAKFGKTESIRKSAKDKLVSHNLKFAVMQAYKYRNHCKNQKFSVHDLIQEANLGLMRAAETFDPDKSVKFISYAVHWINTKINHYVIHNRSIIKLGTATYQKKLFYKKKEIGALQEIDDPDERQIERERLAVKFCVKVKHIEEMELRLGKPDASLDASLSNNEDSNTFVDMLKDDKISVNITEHGIFVKELRAHLRAALDNLRPYHRDIVIRRHINDELNREIGDHFGVSRQAINAVEIKALNHMKAFLIERGITA